jgi:pimeloyl-ACP methyl ester carboxylesterase
MSTAQAIPLLIAIAASIGSVYGIYGVQLFFRQRRIVFRPGRELGANPGDFGQAYERVELALAGGTRVRGWGIFNPSATRLVIWLTGSVGNIAHDLSSLVVLLPAGASVLMIDYPGFGESDGVPSERGCYATAAAAWEYARSVRGFRPEDIIVFGRSLGGTVAAWLAAHRECGGLVILGGLTSVPDIAARRYRWLPARYFCYIRFNTLKYIRKVRCPVLVLHSEADEVIPVEHGVRIYQAARAPKRFLPLRGGHYGADWHSAPELAGELSPLLSGEVVPWN